MKAETIYRILALANAQVPAKYIWTAARGEWRGEPEVLFTLRDPENDVVTIIATNSPRAAYYATRFSSRTCGTERVAASFRVKTW
jgi:hypothetical protein